MARRPWFRICKQWGNYWQWHLVAGNGQTIVSSNMYRTKAHAKRACIAAIKALKLARPDIKEEC